MRWNDYRVGNDKTGQYLASITRYVFVIALVVSEHILQSKVFLSKFLQGIECDLLEATKECKTVIELLRAERLDESVWDELYQSALDLSEPFDIGENMPRRCGRQTTRANHPADTPKQYWKVSLYYAFIDHMIMELESRLIKIRKSLLCTVSASSCYRKYYFTSIDTILCIMFTMLVTSATAKRSFSVLRRLKTYVQSTMNNDRLSSIALMHIHRDFSVDLDKVMEKCVSAKTRRTDFGQF